MEEKLSLEHIEKERSGWREWKREMEEKLSSEYTENERIGQKKSGREKWKRN